MSDLLTETHLRNALREAVSEDRIAGMVLRGDTVNLVLRVEENNAEAARLQSACEDILTKIRGVGRVHVVLTAEAERAPRQEVPRPPSPKPIPGIRTIIAVASGKGGVGKSTVAVNLAAAMAMRGMRVGLVDADIHGPSLARMMGLTKEPDIEKEQMIPPERHGIACMSMGMLLGENVPVVWRGPMVSKALRQLMLGARWGERDALIIDLPPGTGDIHLSIAQNYTLAGVVMVTTPQEIALLDVRKAVAMFRKMGVPILGLVENMAWIEDVSGVRTYPFGQGNVERMAEETGIRILARIPLLPELSASGDRGIPFVTENYEHTVSKEFLNVMTAILT